MNDSIAYQYFHQHLRIEYNHSPEKHSQQLISIDVYSVWLELTVKLQLSALVCFPEERSFYCFDIVKHTRIETDVLCKAWLNCKQVFLLNQSRQR